MSWFFSVVAALIVCGIIFFIGVGLVGSGRNSSIHEEGETLKTWGRIVEVIALLIFVVWAGWATIASSIHEVPANHVLIIKQWGAYVGKTGDGLQMTAPWQQVVQESTSIQRQDYDFNEVPTKQNQAVSAHIVINYNVDPANVEKLYYDYGANWYSILIDPLVPTTVNSITGTFDAFTAHNHPELVSAQIRKYLISQLYSKKHGTDVNIASVNGTFNLPQSILDAVSQKQIAEQQAQTEKNRVDIAKYQGDQKVAYAKKEAEANRALAASISPTLVQYEAVQRLQKNVQVCIVSPGVQTWNPCSIIPGTPGK